jgi:urease accessory protein
MNPGESLLLTLQLGDSFFPSGASAHSYGLEGLSSAGDVTDRGGLEAFLEAQIEQRWASSDRVALLHSYAAGSDLEAVAEIDRFVDRSTCVASWRVGGRRLGRALLSTHAKLGTPLAAAYAGWLPSGRAPGQASVVQGLLGFALGLSASTCAGLSAYGLSVGIVGAGLRLGIIGHLDAQRLLLGQRARTERALGMPLPPLAELGAWVPAAEVGSMSREARGGRLFAS